MPRTQAISHGDRELLDTLAAAGLKGSPSKLERWRGAGFLPPNDRQWRGRKGSASTCTPRARDQVIPLARLMNARRPRYVTALRLFASRLWLSESALRSAYHRWLDDLRKSNELDGTIEASERAARTALKEVKRNPALRGYKRRLRKLAAEERRLDTERRRLLKLAEHHELHKHADRRRLRQLTGHPTDPLEAPEDRLSHALTDAFHVFSTGSPVGDLGDFLDASGISEAFPGEDLPTLEIERILTRFDLGHGSHSELHRVIDETSIEAFEQARDEALLLRDYARATDAVVIGLQDAITHGAITCETLLEGLPDWRLLSQIDDLEAAKQTLWLLMTRHVLGESQLREWEVMIESVRRSLPVFQAQAALIAALPKDMPRFLIDTELNAQPPEARDEILAEIRRAMEAHPEETALLI